MAPTAPPTSVGGRRILRRLGAGGMSEVYLAYDVETRRQVAVKLLAEDLAKNATYVDRFRREADVGQLIDHPNIVRCFGSGQDAKTGRRYLVLEFVKGHSAQWRLEQGGRLPLADATRVMLDIARALEELHHRGYVHRDVKPGNILIRDDGRAKLADLGVAKLLADSAELTSLDQGIGTPFYMPWEQTLNASLVDPRSDLFALGATFYHLITGRVPFPGKDVAEVARLKDEGTFTPPREIDPSLPRSVDTILAKLLARMPKDRFQNAAQLIDVLAASGLTAEKSVMSPLADTEVPPSATRPDLKIAPPADGAAADQSIWTLRFREGEGWRKGRARTADVTRWFEEGLLPDEFFLARAGHRTCRHFRTYPEFRELKRKTREVPAADRKKFRFFGLCLGFALALTASVSGLLHFFCAAG